MIHLPVFITEEKKKGKKKKRKRESLVSLLAKLGDWTMIYKALCKANNLCIYKAYIFIYLRFLIWLRYVPVVCVTSMKVTL